MKRVLLSITLFLGVICLNLQNAQAQDQGQDVSKTVEQMPTFPGGQDAYYKYISENIKYPKAAKEKGIEGKVFVSFIVDKDGSLDSFKVVRGIGGGCQEEALRVLKKMPDWNPGLQKGSKVRTQVESVITFTL